VCSHNRTLSQADYASETNEMGGITYCFPSRNPPPPQSTTRPSGTPWSRKNNSTKKQGWKHYVIHSGVLNKLERQDRSVGLCLESMGTYI